MADTEETPTQRQARLRREKREKKLLEGGSARLDKITGRSGRSYEDTPPNPDSGAATPAHADVDDPPEADISTATPPPRAAASGPSPPELDAQAAQIRALLRNGGPAPGEQDQGGEADPMMQLLQQMLGGAGAAGGPPGAGADPSAAPDASGLPPGLAALLGGAAGGAQQAGPPPPPPKSTYAWRVAHVLASLLLAAYVLWAHPFAGPAAARGSDVLLGDSPAANVFWLFATVELALQSGRLMLRDGAAAPLPGVVGMVVGVLPSPWGGRVRMASQYVSIVGTMVGDAMVLVFVLGAAAWWHGLTA